MKVPHDLSNLNVRHKNINNLKTASVYLQNYYNRKWSSKCPQNEGAVISD